MTASEITITETSGSDPITIVLRGRALPYRGMPTGTKQRVQTTWYQGNPKATQQILGTEFEDTTINGVWKAKFLRVQDSRLDVTAFGLGDATISGNLAEELSAGPNAAAILVTTFERLLARGNELRFEWGPVVRFGILSGFEPKWQREEDVEWSMDFDWNGRDQFVVGSGLLAHPGRQLQQAVVDTDSSAVKIPTRIVEAPARSATFSQLGVIRDAAIGILSYTRLAASYATLPASVVQGALGQAVQIRDDVTILTGQMMDVPYTYLCLSDSVENVLSVESWRRDVGIQAETLAAKAQQEADQLESFTQNGDFTTVIVKQGQSLRHVALKYYGDPDAWTVIAEANHLSTSNVPAGTSVQVPTRLVGISGELVQ